MTAGSKGKGDGKLTTDTKNNTADNAAKTAKGEKTVTKTGAKITAKNSTPAPKAPPSKSGTPKLSASKKPTPKTRTPKAATAKPDNFKPTEKPNGAPKSTVSSSAMASAAMKKSGNGAASIVGLVLVLGITAGAAYATLPLWQPYADPYLSGNLKVKLAELSKTGSKPKITPTEDVAAKAVAKEGDALKDLKEERQAIDDEVSPLLQHLNDLEAQLAAVRKMVDATSMPLDAAEANDSLSKLNSRLSHLENNSQALDDLMQRIAKLEQQGGGGNVNLSTSLSSLEERLGNLEKTDFRLDGAQAMVLAVGQLREVLRRSGSFSKELKTLKALAPNELKLTQAIGVLEGHAASGVATADMLKRRFSDLAGSIVSADATMKGDGWIETAVNRMRSLVTMRRTDGAPTGSVDAVVADAETQLKNGDLTAAVGLVEELQGPAAKVAEVWMKDAKARLDVEKAMASLHVHSVALLAPMKE